MDTAAAKAAIDAISTNYFAIFPLILTAVGAFAAANKVVKAIRHI